MSMSVQTSETTLTNSQLKDMCRAKGIKMSKNGKSFCKEELLAALGFKSEAVATKGATKSATKGATKGATEDDADSRAAKPVRKAPETHAGALQVGVLGVGLDRMVHEVRAKVVRGKSVTYWAATGAKPVNGASYIF